MTTVPFLMPTDTVDFGVPVQEREDVDADPIRSRSMKQRMPYSGKSSGACRTTYRACAAR